MASAKPSFNIDEFRAYLAIDKHRLDEELMAQPGLFFKVSDEYALACADRDTAKDDLARLTAEIYPKVKANLEKAGKATEAAIQAGIALDKKHQAAVKVYSDARYWADLTLALKEAFIQRSYMLREMAHLFSANYFDRAVVEGTGRRGESLKADAIKEQMSTRRDTNRSRPRLND